MKRFVLLIGLAHALPAQDQFITRRVGHYFVVELRGPHRVVSTSAVTGGQSDAIRFLVNHQSMEAAGDVDRHTRMTSMTEQQYHASIAKVLGVDPAQMAVMGTAANMNCMAHRHLEYRDLKVDVFVTGGVEANATRSGDPTTFYEEARLSTEPPHGTINTILIVNRPLTAGAQARAVVTMTEAKFAALAELATPSGVSQHLATGTGTDQFIIAVPLDAATPGLRWTGSHSKLGELIGQAVRAATRETLRWQNGLESSYTRDITRALGRFGLNHAELLRRLQAALPAGSYDLFVKNRLALTYDPRLAAAAYAYAAVLDRAQYGTLPAELTDLCLRDAGATAAVALSSSPARWPEFWNRLPERSEDRLEPFLRGIVMGWQARWAE